MAQSYIWWWFSNREIFFCQKLILVTRGLFKIWWTKVHLVGPLVHPFEASGDPRCKCQSQGGFVTCMFTCLDVMISSITFGAIPAFSLNGVYTGEGCNFSRLAYQIPFILFRFQNAGFFLNESWIWEETLHKRARYHWGTPLGLKRCYLWDLQFLHFTFILFYVIRKAFHHFPPMHKSNVDNN